ncbi:MAG TPA: hypothetical protein VK686_23665 [Bryobacteraceae bacterium]|nr:hypothetical protein [Bryobacteraceae bacterium]
MSVGLLTPAITVPQQLTWHPQAELTNIPRIAALPVAYETQMVVEVVKHKIYPYSLVPGGAEDVRQAKIAMADPAIKAQYAGINMAQLKQVKLTSNLSGYVSYRWGDKIYWTKKALTLRAGETVFTDGTHIVRGRCLNCYSAMPMLPVRPNEPTAVAFDTPGEMPVTVYSFPRLPVMAPELPIPPGELTPTVPVLPAVVGSTIGKVGGGRFWFPILPIIPPIHHHPGSPTSPNSPFPPPGIPVPVVVPEPSYAWILAAGFLAIALANRLRPQQRI